MRHGIDLKTHSQCQRRQPRLPDRPEPDRLSFHPGNLVAGGAYRDRTDDPLLAKQVLSQLS